MRARGLAVGAFRSAGLVALLALLLASGPPLAAQAVGTAFTYQGQLNDAGSPANGPYDFEFRLFDSPGAMNQVGPVVTVGDVAVAGGLFTVGLDFGAVFNGNKRWLQISVRPGASSGGYTVLFPLQELAPSPNAVSVPWTGLTGVPAGFADGIDDDSGGDITGVTAGTGLGGGGTTGTVTLNVNFAGSGAAATASRSDHDHFGQTWAPGAAPNVDGLTINTNSPVAGHSAFTGIHSGTTTPGFGLWGRTQSTAGVAVHGEATSGTGITTGVEGISNSTAGTGVYGFTASGTGPTVGVYGRSLSTSGYGVWGRGESVTGQNTGVYGESYSSGGSGVRGQGSVGVWGVSPTQGGTGVRGDGTAGILGISSTGVGVNGTTSTGYGVYGLSSTSTGLAGKFIGDVDIVGVLSKSSGAFKIDHPLDPENKYLYHSFVESPDMKNIYDGIATTDAAGRADVELPAWFGSLNRDFRYQLTVIGQFAQAIVGEEIEDNRFTIRTSQGGVKVSWQVTGIRKDPFAERHRIRVEVDKPGKERGTYLHPADYGQPEEKGVEYGPSHDGSYGAVMGKAVAVEPWKR